MALGALLVEAVLVTGHAILSALAAEFRVRPAVCGRQLRPRHAGLVPERALLLMARVALRSFMAARAARARGQRCLAMPIGKELLGVRWGHLIEVAARAALLISVRVMRIIRLGRAIVSQSHGRCRERQGQATDQKRTMLHDHLLPGAAPKSTHRMNSRSSAADSGAEEG